MKLILRIDFVNDTYCAVDILPFEYSSKKDAIDDFFRLYDESVNHFLWYDNWKRENQPKWRDPDSVNEYVRKHEEIYDSEKFSGSFEFLNTSFYYYDFSKENVKIFELNEWFEMYKLS
jgi:hypothetical protein